MSLDDVAERAAAVPPPPPGYTLDARPSAKASMPATIAPLPDGFRLDNPEHEKLIKPEPVNFGSIARGWNRLQQAGGVLAGELGLMSPEQVAEFVAAQEEDLKQYPVPDDVSAGLREIVEARGLTGVARALWENLGVLPSVIGESLPMSLPGIATGGLGGVAGGGPGAMVGLGAGSGLTEYASSLMDYMSDQGLDPNDPDAVAAALTNREFMAEARDYAAKRGLAIGAFDAFTAGLAGKVGATVLRGGKTARRLAAGGGAAASIEAAGGAGGEAAAQLATEGEINPGEVALEGVAEIVPGVGEAIITSRSGRGSEAEAQTETDAVTPSESDATGRSITFSDPATDTSPAGPLDGERGRITGVTTDDLGQPRYEVTFEDGRVVNAGERNVIFDEPVVPQEAKTDTAPIGAEEQRDADERASIAAPAQPPESEGPAVSPPAVASSPAATDDERATLRRSQLTDDDIDIMSREEIAAEVEKAVAAGVKPSDADIAAAREYRLSQIEPEITISPEEITPDDSTADPSISDRVALSPEGSREKPATVDLPEQLEQAGARVNTAPSEAQREAGNYQKAHIRIGGLDITIENPKGSIRTGKTPNGEAWSVEMPAAYGYVKRTAGADGDQVDVYVGDDPKSKRVFVIDQIDPDSRVFDEHKAVMGVESPREARALYAKGFSDGRGEDRIGAVTPMTLDRFAKWLKEDDTSKPLRFESEPDDTSASMRDLGYRAGVDPEYVERVREAVKAGDGDVAAAMEQAALDLEREAGIALDTAQDTDNAAQSREPPEGRPVVRETGEPREGRGSQGEAESSGVETKSRGESGSDRKREAGDERGAGKGAEERKPEAVATETVDTGDGKREQAVIPGTERISDKELAERKAGKPMRGSGEQKDPGGLFSDAKDQTDLLDFDPDRDIPAFLKKDRPVTAPKPDTTGSTSSETKSPDRIEDFGEELHGARKHLAQQYATALAEDIDVAAEPLSKSFPAPNYKKLAEDGIPSDTLALIAVMRDSIPNKPRRGYKVRMWATSVEQMRSFANKLLSGEQSSKQMYDLLEDSAASDLRSIAYTARAIRDVSPELLPQAAKWRVRSGSYSLFAGQRFDRPKTMYFVQDARGRMAMARTGMEQASTYDETLEGITDKAAIIIRSALALAAKKPSERSKYTDLKLYRGRGSKDIYVAFKVRSTVIRLKGGFDNAKDARAYIEENRDDLQSKIDEMRAGPRERREANDPRKGRDWREGNIAPGAFSEAFGFRGVQFGNYVENDRRQADLDRAYDALMDLADTLGIPPRALSLDGKLGLAFGARGRGGKNAPAAHYEPGSIVINLTKNAGPGSLAHEWLHGLDNYFARQDEAGGYMSERRRDSGPVRPEVYEAWKGVEHAISTGSFADRSAEFDKARSKPYFGTTIEKAARAFERYIVDRLAANGFTNDYLANIDLDGGAYPTSDEMDGGIRGAYDALFNAIEHEETASGNVRLYSDVAPIGWGDVQGGVDTGTRLNAAQRADIEQIVMRVANVSPEFRDRIYAPQGSPGLAEWGNSETDSTAAGYFEPATDAIVIALNSADRRTAYHEAFHRLQFLFLNDAERSVLAREQDRLREIVMTREGRRDQVAGMSPIEIEAEAFAIWSDQMDRNGADGIRLHIGVRRAWTRIRQMVRRVRAYLVGEGYAEVFERARSGEMASRMPRDHQRALREKAIDVALTRDGLPAYSMTERIPDMPPRQVPGALVTDRISLALRSGVARIKSISPRDRSTQGDGETGSDYLHRKWVDYLHPLRMMQEASGVPLSDLNDAYMNARLAEDAALAGIQNMHDKYVTPMVDALVQGNASLEDLHSYLYASHAEERNRVVGLRNPDDSDLYKAATDPTIKGASGISTDEARGMLAELQQDHEKFAAIRRAAGHVRAMLDQSLRDQRSAGLISQETYDLLTSQWSNYVPLKGQDGMDDRGNWQPVSRGGFDVRGDEFKSAMGRFSEADNIIANAVTQSEMSVLRQKKNDIGKAMLRFINEFDPKGESVAQVYWTGEETFGDITKAPKVQQRVIGPDGKVTTRTVPNPFQNKDDVLATKVGGKTYFIRFKDPKIGHAVRNLGAAQIDTLSKLVRNVTVWQSIVNTRANPAFTPINVIRDVQTGAVHLLDEGFSTSEIAKVVAGIPKAWGALWRHSRGKAKDAEWDRWAKEYFDNGGKITFHGYTTMEESLARLKSEIAAGVSGEATPKRVGKAILKFVGNLNDAGENGIRLAAYVAARQKQGRTAKQAAFLARDLTVDFKKHGEIGPLVNSWYVFFNAALQGNYNIARRMARSKKVQAAVGSFVFAGMMQGVWNSLMAGADDDGESYYAKMLRNEPWKLERQFVFFLPGSSEYVSFPLPYGYNAFHHLGVQGHAITTGQKDAGVAILDAARVAFDAFNPIGSGSIASMVSPTIADPAVEIVANENFFGSPIYPSENPFDRAPPPDSSKSFSSTHPAFKWIAEQMNDWTGGTSVEPGLVDVHPDTLEHIWGFFTGGLGRFASQTQETAVRTVQGEYEPKKTPWVRSFYGRIDEDSQRSEYFRQRQSVLEADGYLKDYAERGKSGEIADFQKRHRVEIESIAAFKAAEKERRKLNKHRRQIEADSQLSASEKRQQLDRLDEIELEIMKMARQAFADARQRAAED